MVLYIQPCWFCTSTAFCSKKNSHNTVVQRVLLLKASRIDYLISTDCCQSLPHLMIMYCTSSHLICDCVKIAQHASGNKMNKFSWHALCARAPQYWLGFALYAINSWKWSPISNPRSLMYHEHRNTYCTRYKSTVSAAGSTDLVAASQLTLFILAK